MISISPKAIKAIKATLEQHKEDKLCVRVGIKGSSCDGSFIFGLDKQAENDELHLIQGIPVIINKKHMMHVMGASIDLSEKSGNSVFTVSID